MHSLSHPDVRQLLETRLHDPFRVLGPHAGDHGQITIRAFLPRSRRVELVEADAAMERLADTDLFQWQGPPASVPERYRLRWEDDAQGPVERFDPYCFPPQIGDDDLSSFGRGEHVRAQEFLGAHRITVDEVSGVRFAVWAPNAERVSVVGDFNHWDGRQHPMRVRGGSGVWELFIPGLAGGELYKFELRNREAGTLHIKTDPYARACEHRPATASVVATPCSFAWGDEDWLSDRSQRDWLSEPITVYEVHPASWRRQPSGEPLSYEELGRALAAYVKALGFTHVELMPITEHPLDDSWGYQSTGYFAPTRRFGDAAGVKALVDHLHGEGIGVLLDWVPGHFPKDGHAMARFDGSPLYEYADPRKGEQPDWGTLIFDYGRNEVRSFLLSSALHWLEEFHFDGLRVDAVASMLYLDYSRNAGEWAPNAYGGNENLEAVDFIRRLNELTHHQCPGTLTIAEESTAWPGVSRPTYTGGLGFTFKWNMGWMHDTLLYLSKDPVHRKHHHNLLSFGPLYAFSENFMLPLSHDEVVHGKGSLLAKMPGDEWQRFANLRLTYTFQWTYPGKKLLFMGSEFGEPNEWNHAGSLDWHLLEDPKHGGIHALIRDLNALYRRLRPLHHWDVDSRGFEWLRWDESDQSVLSYLRRDEHEEVIVLLNFTPVPRHGYRVGVPADGTYREIFNSDSRFYGGTDVGNPLELTAEPVPCTGHAHSVVLTLPPLAGVLLKRA